MGEILQGKEISLGEGKVAPLHALLTSLPFLQCGLTSLNVQKAGLDMLTPLTAGTHGVVTKIVAGSLMLG